MFQAKRYPSLEWCENWVRVHQLTLKDKYDYDMYPWNRIINSSAPISQYENIPSILEVDPFGDHSSFVCGRHVSPPPFSPPPLDSGKPHVCQNCICWAITDLIVSPTDNHNTEYVWAQFSNLFPIKNLPVLYTVTKMFGSESSYLAKWEVRVGSRFPCCIFSSTKSRPIQARTLVLD